MIYKLSIGIYIILNMFDLYLTLNVKSIVKAAILIYLYMFFTHNIKAYFDKKPIQVAMASFLRYEPSNSEERLIALIFYLFFISALLFLVGRSILLAL